MTIRRTTPRLMLVLVLLLTLIAGWQSETAAQDTDTTPTAGPERDDAGHPGHIHEGSCDDGELGDVVEPLTNAVAPSGEPVGSSAAIPAAVSVATVAMTLSEMLGADHAINFHQSVAEIETYIACGEIGGQLDEAGDLAIGLKDVEGSGFTGVAFLSPSDTDPAETDVTVFLVEGLGGGSASGNAPVATIAPTPAS